MRHALWILFLTLLLVLPVHAQDTQAVLNQIAAEVALDHNAGLVIALTTPDGTITAVSGLADGQRPVVAADRFRIASMSKTFVAVVTLKLAEQNVFRLDDHAAAWLPSDVRGNLANASQVTIRQLLAMRSGIPDYLETDAFWDVVSDDPQHPWTAKEALTYAYGEEALFAPGAEFYYSNSNYLLLQLLLEEASGKPLHTLVRQFILDPLRLGNTYTQNMEDHTGGFINGYEDFDGDGVPENVTLINDGAGLGDGALISNAADLARFYQALLAEQTLLTPESMAALLDFDPDEGYSLGLMEWETSAGTAWGHSGALLGFTSEGAYLPQAKATIIVLAASGEADPDQILTEVIDRILN